MPSMRTGAIWSSCFASGARGAARIMQPTRVQTPCRQTFDNDHLLRYVEKGLNRGRDWRLRGGNRRGAQILKVAERLGLLIREVQAFL